MDSDTEIQVCLVVKAKSVSVVRNSPRLELRPPEKEVRPMQTLELGRLQLHVSVDRAKWKPFPASSPDGSAHKEHCVEMGTKARVMLLSQGNPNTPSCGLDASDSALSDLVSSLWDFGGCGMWQDL